MKHITSKIFLYNNIEYEIFNDGKLKSVKYRGGMFLKPYTTNSGYYCVKLGGKKNPKHFYIHRLVAEYFVKNKNNNKYVNHIDGNKLNNSFKNLEWCTASYNYKHAIQNGLCKNYGENTYNASLNESDAREIIRFYNQYNLNFTEIAYLFNVTPRVTRSIIRGERWKHLTK